MICFCFFSALLFLFAAGWWLVNIAPPLFLFSTPSFCLFLFLFQPPFPPSLLSSPTPFAISSPTVTWFSPTTLPDLLALKRLFPSAKIVVGNTEVGIEQKFKSAVYPVLISGSNVPDLQQLTATSAAYVFGSCTPLSDVSNFCASLPPSPLPLALHNMLRWFASTQIRNTASLAGNLATASPVSDMNPMLAAAGATMTVVSADSGSRDIKVEDFFLSYRTTALAPAEVIVSVTVPKLSPFEYILPFKQAKRREDDISIVTAGIRVALSPSDSSEDGEGWIVTGSALAFGGMAATTVSCPKTSAFLLLKPWCAETFSAAESFLAEDLPLPDDVPGGQPEYRRALASSFLFKFFVATSVTLAEDIAATTTSVPLPPPPHIASSSKSASLSFVTSPKPSTRGTQRHPNPKTTPGLEDNAHRAPREPRSAPAAAGAGLPVTHASGALHCTGEAE